MKVGFCMIAFVIGCLMTVFMGAKAPGISDGTESPSLRSEQPPSTAPLTSQDGVQMEIITRQYGVTNDGQEITQFICRNDNGYALELINYGATVTAFRAPDKNGKSENITLSCPNLAGYEACTSYFGSTVGRYCNRIAKGKFSIGDQTYTLATNNGDNHLHGGVTGFDKRVWQAERIATSDKVVGVRFKLSSEDGDEGYPGKLAVTVEYTIDNNNELKVEFTATTDKPTHLNLTNHNYWNLDGAGANTIKDHVLQLESDQYVPVDSQGIPTGEVLDVSKTPFDFTTAQKIGSRIDELQTDPVGYDHNYALRAKDGKLALAATVISPASGRKMEILTTQPGIQFYTGNFLDGLPGSGGFNQYGALCLETQHFPDAPNQPSFKSTLLKPGETYRQTTVHRFSVK